MLRVVVPHVALRAETRDVLDASAWTAAYVGYSDDAYYDLLGRLWAACGASGDGLVNVEQDVIPPDGFLESLAACDEPWCTYAIPRHNHPDQPLTNSLGLVRFSAALIASEPDLMAAVGKFSAGMPPKHWAHLDVAVYETLRARGYGPHVHEPAAIHLPKLDGPLVS
jgi:hypothetical protein